MTPHGMLRRTRISTLCARSSARTDVDPALRERLTNAPWTSWPIDRPSHRAAGESRREADRLIMALRSMEAPEPGVDVNPMTQQLHGAAAAQRALSDGPDA